MANLWARKPMNMLLAEAGESGERSLKRTLGPFQLTALGVGAVIGAGIFVLSGLGAHYAGPGLMLSFVLSGLGCAFAALCGRTFCSAQWMKFVAGMRCCGRGLRRGRTSRCR